MLLTPHLGCFEVTAQAYAERLWRTHADHRALPPGPQALAARAGRAARARPGLATAPASLAGVRQMIRALRRGEAVGLLPDQVPPEGMGVWAPFFGRAGLHHDAGRAAGAADRRGVLLLGRAPAARRAATRARAARSPSRCRAGAMPTAAARTRRGINRAMERLIRAVPAAVPVGLPPLQAAARAAPAAVEPT